MSIVPTFATAFNRAAAEWSFGYVVTDVLPRSVGRKVVLRRKYGALD